MEIKHNKKALERIQNTIDIEALSEKLKTWLFRKHDIIKALARLVIELESKLTDYDTVLSDEASGRLVSLFLRNIINEKRKQIGKHKAQIYFINGGDYYSQDTGQAVKNFISEKKQTFGKSLLVTEYILSGNGMMSLIGALRSQDIDFDMAVVSIRKKPRRYKDKHIKRVKYGSIGFTGALFHRNYEFSGVEKEDSDIRSAHPVRHKRSVQKDIRIAREDIKLLSTELLKLLD